ncbi:MAG: hypothetical protein ABFC84_10385 [Veillonellales bacterium]
MEVKTKLLKGLKKMIADPEFQKDVEGLGLQVEYSELDETQAYLLSDKQNLDKAVNESGVIDLIKSQKNSKN